MSIRICFSKQPAQVTYKRALLYEINSLNKCSLIRRRGSGGWADRRQILRRSWHDERLSNLLKTASGFALCLTEVTGWRIMRCYLLNAGDYLVEFVRYALLVSRKQVY